MIEYTKMPVKKAQPPILGQIERALGVYPKDQPVYCYDGVIYNPYERKLTPDVEVHEHVHEEQQKKLGVDVWWTKYLIDTKFRKQQEIEAYGTQYAFAKQFAHGALREWALNMMVTSLSGESYGFLMKEHEANAAIRRYAKSIV